MRLINSLNNVDLPYDKVHIQLTYQEKMDDAPECYKIEAGFINPVQDGDEIWILGAYSSFEKQLEAWGNLHKATLEGKELFIFPENDI